ncbi:hypothetical protein RSOL_375800 [Rhizoctonia solani AG-3 Rhs1AP]|uniref:F-box domain-containing protein n=1 Tax=Rhizoctonia solani AG-3 Rhs1AP TaxID=1086054 RepID=X8JA77_9AGAM|nr:hypothetical protein RSOL_375800 [Rhizoctonia solani AG-3 Rhs1AP]
MLISWDLTLLLAESTEDGRDAGSEYDKSVQEDSESPPRKRWRTTQEQTKVPPHKKRILDKRSFATLADMPLDIFIEVAAYLLPIDIISLARLTKSTRIMLMHRSSIHVWHASMRNIQGLPDCPPDLSEPYFLSLIFMKKCSACGVSTRARLDETLRVRFCGPCRTEHLVHGAGVPRELEKFLHWSTRLTPPQRRSGDYILRVEYEAIMVEHKQIMQAQSEKALKEWTTEKEAIKDRQRRETDDLTRFMEALETDRQKERKATSEARWIEVPRRLQEMGWEPGDMDFTQAGFTRQQEWRALVLQPKPITDRVWARLIPKLIPLLEINRKQRLRRESWRRKDVRANHLKGLMDGLEQTGYSASKLEVNLRLPLPQDAYSTTTVTYQAPFPTFPRVLMWPALNDMHNTEMSIADINEIFELRSTC